MSGDDSKKIVEFKVPPEERARRLKVEVERLARLPPVEWLLYLNEGVAEKHGVSRTILREMIEATIKEREKKARENKVEDRQRERRVEKEQTKARREQREQKRELERADKEGERKRKEREKAFEAIAKLPRLAHEARLAELARRSGEDLDFLRDEFAAYYVPTDIDTKPIEPWDQPEQGSQVWRCRLSGWRPARPGQPSPPLQPRGGARCRRHRGRGDRRLASAGRSSGRRRTAGRRGAVRCRARRALRGIRSWPSYAAVDIVEVPPARNQPCQGADRERGAARDRGRRETITLAVVARGRRPCCTSPRLHAGSRRAADR
jgi:hypothetical protein